MRSCDRFRRTLAGLLALAAALPAAAGPGSSTDGIRYAYVVPRSHLDIGFNHSVPEVIALQKDYLDDAVDYADQHPACRWTIESVWQRDPWLAQTSDPAQITRLRRLIAQGRIELTAGDANMHQGLRGREELNRFLYPARRCEERWGLDLDTLISDDVPGSSQALLDVYESNGYACDAIIALMGFDNDRLRERTQYADHLVHIWWYDLTPPFALGASGFTGRFQGPNGWLAPQQDWIAGTAHNTRIPGHRVNAGVRHRLLTSMSSRPIRLATLGVAAAVAVSATAADDERFANVPAGEEAIHVYGTRFGLAPAQAAPPRAEGAGPFARLVVRGATLIDGTGAPPVGPVDVVVERDRIAEIRQVGSPGAPIRAGRRPAPGEHEIDASGMYLLPGFVEAHGHIAHPLLGLAGEVPPAEYVYKLWLAHGITTVREVGSGNGLRWTLEQKAQSEDDRITAPRILAYAWFPSAAPAVRIHTPERARAWVREVARAGADGIKFRGCPPAVMRAALAEAAAAGLPTASHHEQLTVVDTNVLHTSEWGLSSMEHWYGLPEAMFTDRTVQDFPPAYNHNDEQDRFREAGRLWAQAAPPGSERWNAVRDALLARDFTLVPTLGIYEASRDLMRAMRAEWHDEYTLPALWRWFQPSREAHGSYWFSWTTGDEIAWKGNYALWMRFLDDYKDHGGRVAAGSDAGFIFSLFGFGYVRELELLQEAGFHPLEVIRSATLEGAELARVAAETGSVATGKLADFVIVGANPLANLKVLYGTGAFALDDATGRPTRAGGIAWTVKGGVVYDAKALLADVRAMVASRKAGASGAAP